MIRVYMDNRGGDFTLTVRGHANSAPKGEDVICAAVSTLLLTLAAALRRAQAKNFSCTLGEGDARIRVKKDKKTAPMLFCIACGLDFLAQTYPDHIQMETEEA